MAHDFPELLIPFADVGDEEFYALMAQLAKLRGAKPLPIDIPEEEIPY